MPPPTTSAASSAPRLAPWAGRLLVALFVVAIALPGLATAVGLGQETRGNEAETTGTSLMARAARFDTHFAFRDRFVQVQSRLRYQLLGVSSLATVWKGRDGWWFFATDGDVEATLNESRFTPAELERWRVTLQHTADFLAARGIAHVFVIAPGKAAVHPEGLPAGLHPRPAPTRTDQLVDTLRTRSTVTVVDLRDGLLAARRGAEPLFHRTDTHWNDVGAAVGYRQILGALAGRVPGLAPPAGPDGFGIVSVPTATGDLATMLGLEGTLGEAEWRLTPAQPRRARIIEPRGDHKRFAVPRVVTVVDDPHLPKAVVYRDSFGSALVPFLAEHFQRMVTLWEYDVVPATIREEQPQVVIQQWVGRRLYNRVPYDAVAADPDAMAEIAAHAAASSSAAARR
jgi:hypothetical protein